jgi:dTDP-4-dehydrorhamnose 3,5-epimerase-like enzyme
MSVSRCRLIDLPSHADARGGLTFIEEGKPLPFAIKRVYYLYDVPPGQGRGAHAHRELEQLFIAIAGSFEITVDDGQERRTMELNGPARGLYLPPMLWRDLGRFSPGAVCLVLASALYAEEDYIREYDRFLAVVRGQER